MRTLVALPVFNEAQHVQKVLDEVRPFAEHIVVIDDGSTDATPDILRNLQDIDVVRHSTNRGYGAAIHSAIRYAASEGYERLVTIDCDGQHSPKRIPLFVDALAHADVVSGSRYLHRFDGDSTPPFERFRINRVITQELNEQLRLKLTDAFCGFKGYRVAAVADLPQHETGYAMPLEFWAEAAAAHLKIRELPVPLIYLDEERSFGGALDQSDTRLAHYREVLERSIARIEARRLSFVRQSSSYLPLS